VGGGGGGGRGLGGPPLVWETRGGGGGARPPLPITCVGCWLRARWARARRAGRPADQLDLGLGLGEQARRQRRIVDTAGELLPVAVDVIQERLERRGLRRVRIFLVGEDPRRRRDRVGGGARRVQRVERQVLVDLRLADGGRGPFETRGHELAVLVLHGRELQLQRLRVREVAVADTPVGALDRLPYTRIALARLLVRGPRHGRAGAERPDAWCRRVQERGEVLRRAGAVGPVHDRDR